MKKYLLSLCIFISFSAFSQNLDTIYVRNLTLQAQDWAILVSTENVYQDSTTAAQFRRVQTAIKAVPNITWTTNVTVDSLKGSIVLSLYNAVKRAPAGVIVSRYTAITNAISSKTVLSTFLTNIDAGFTSAFNQYRDKGKTIILD
jgi:hypothetical protein